MGKYGWLRSKSQRRGQDSSLALLLLLKKQPWLMMKLLKRYGPEHDIYLNLPHLQQRKHGPLVNNTQRFKRERLDEFKRNMLLSQSYSSSSSPSTESRANTTTSFLDEKTSTWETEKMLEDDQNKPQMDLNEFLQQMGILKDKSRA
ncbi:Dehydration-responsive element-binding protein 2F [Raphanus sativus]|nr:Dehydration-responsive element-binding protein 2F [Raphanus sativus]